MKKKKVIWALRNGSLIDCTNHLPHTLKSVVVFVSFYATKNTRGAFSIVYAQHSIDAVALKREGE